MFKYLAVLFFLSLSASANNSSTQKSTPIPPALAAIEKKYLSASTLKAEFTQINETIATQQKKTTSGEILVKHPNKLFWKTLKPDENLLVSDGKTFWFYTPPFDEEEKGQVIQKKTAEVQSKLATALLSGSFSTSAKNMKIRQTSETHFVLTPLRGTGGSVVKAELDVDLKRNIIEKVLLTHDGGNRSEITLSNVSLGEKIPDDTFQFTPPPGTERIKN